MVAVKNNLPPRTFGALSPLLTRIKLDKAKEALKAQDTMAIAPAAERAKAFLPRANKVAEKAPQTTGSLIQRIGGYLREHKTAVAGVLMGATLIPGLTGCATTGMATARAIPSTPNPFDDTQSPEAKLETLKAKAAEINSKRGTASHTELTEMRENVYKHYVNSGGTLGVNTDGDGDGVNLAREILYGTDDKNVDSDGDMMSDAYEIQKGFDPADAQHKGTADVKGWVHGYIPMSNNPMIEDNTLFFYDMVMKERTGTDPQMRHIEGGSALADGHYFLSSTLDENNAELTTGIDYNGDGVLTPGVKHDFLSPGHGEANFGGDGKTETTLSVGWWGHCNDVASAGVNFREPKNDVTIELANPITRFTVMTSHGTFHAEKVTKGTENTDILLLSGQTVRLKNSDVQSTEKETFEKVTFTPTKLKELASELVHRGSKLGTDFVGSRFYGREATLTLKDGTTVSGGLVSSLHDRAETTEGSYTTATKFTKDVTMRVFDFEAKTWTNKTYKAEDIKSVYAENARDVAPVTFHETMMKWLGSEKKAGVMDKDAGTHVWNYSFDRYEITKADKRASDKNTVDYEMKVFFSGNSFGTTYNYSITYEDGQPKTGTWAEHSPNPDFFWRHRGGADGFNHESAGDSTPISPKVVFELLEKSYALEDASPGGGTP